MAIHLPLTRAQREVKNLLDQGLTVQEIANHRGCSRQAINQLINARPSLRAAHQRMKKAKAREKARAKTNA